MKESYSDVRSFIQDAKSEITMQDLLIGLGVVTEDDFHGSFIRCPFHSGGQERTPSMQVGCDPEAGGFWFRCYACGVKGDGIKFLETYYGSDFMDAVRTLAEHLGVNVNKATYHHDGMAQRVAEEWRMYQKNMKNAPAEMQALCQTYFPEDVGLDTALGTDGYLVIPIRSKNGKVLGFTKRRVNDADEPKWKHSRGEYSLINQVHNFYNLHYATPYITHLKEVVITEGPKDCIAYRRVGVDNAIAVCGSQNTKHLMEVLPQVRRVIISMDSDQGGVKGTISMIHTLISMVDMSDITVVALPDGEDPYDAQDHLMECYHNRIPAMQWLVEHADRDQVRDLYAELADHEKPALSNAVADHYGMTQREALSWLTHHAKERRESDGPSEQDILLSIMGIGNAPIPPGKMMTPEKAESVLRMKYGWKPEK